MNIANTSVSQYLEAILNLKEYNPEGDFIFRGHSSLTYKLIPKIGRTQDPLEIVLRRELQSFNEFKRLYGRFYHQSLKRDMDILMLSQHYGLPTRLLDWTFDPLVALYFACESKNNEDGEVLIKCLPNTKILLEEKNDISPFKICSNTFIMPESFETRFINQNGLFEIYANPLVESNLMYYGSIIIKGQAKASMLNQLSMLRYTLVDIYPSLDNLCKVIETKYQKINIF